MTNGEQLALFEIKREVNEANKQIRNWENAFQRWSNKQMQDGSTSCGACGYGSMCEWCEGDISVGRPCVRALNAMCREKRIKIDYDDYDFTKVW